MSHFLETLISIQFPIGPVIRPDPAAMSAIYILDSMGRVLINFDYRGEVDFSIPDKFMSRLQATDLPAPPPVFRVDEWTFIFVTRSTLYFFVVTRTNSNVALLIVFLDALAHLFEEFLDDSLSAELIVDNFTLIYELLDEVMDYGYPQTVDCQSLSAYILREKPKDVAKVASVATNLPTGLVTWRPEGLHYNVNEAFVDVIENVNMLVGRNDAIIHNEIVGELNLTCYLSGMPELRIGLNDVLVMNPSEVGGDFTRRFFQLEDVKFHACVRLSQYEKDRSITFVPPDGQFNLMKYRLSSTLHPIIRVTAKIERYKGSRVELNVTAKADFRKETVAQSVKISVPVPPDVDTPKAQATSGKMAYSPKDDRLVWTLKKFAGGKEFQLKAHFGLPSLERDDEDARRPIDVSFEIPYFTVSGLQVQYLKVFEKSGYEGVNWVRYMTLSGTYQFRT
jgi:AP-1 complex subunit mu